MVATDNRPPVWLSGVVAAANVIALADMPYGYYQLLRITVTGYAIWVAICVEKRRNSALVWIFGLVAVLYNPIIEIHMTRETHAFVNLLTAGLIATELYLSRRRPSV